MNQLLSAKEVPDNNSELKTRLKNVILSVPFPSNLKAKYLDGTKPDEFQQNVAGEFIDELFSIFELNEDETIKKYNLPPLEINPRIILMYLLSSIQTAFILAAPIDISGDSIANEERHALADEDNFLKWIYEIERSFVETLPPSSQIAYEEYRSRVSDENIRQAFKTMSIEPNLPEYDDRSLGSGLV